MEKLKIKRGVDKDFDQKPSIAHHFRYDLCKKAIEGNKVLDVGCWTGQFTGLVAPLCQVTGIDINREAIKFAQKHHPQAVFLLASVLSLPFDDNSFDVVTFWEVLEHLPKGEEKKAFKEISRVLKNKGRLFLSVPNDHLISKLFDPAYFLLGHHHYSEEQLKEFLLPLGFKIDEVFYKGGIFRVFYSNYEMLWKHVLKAKLVPIKFIEKKVQEELRNKTGFESLYLEVSLLKQKDR